MTIEELYDWAKERGYENYDICMKRIGDTFCSCSISELDNSNEEDSINKYYYEVYI